MNEGPSSSPKDTKPMPQGLDEDFFTLYAPKTVPKNSSIPTSTTSQTIMDVRKQELKKQIEQGSLQTHNALFQIWEENQSIQKTGEVTGMVTLKISNSDIKQMLEKFEKGEMGKSTPSKTKQSHECEPPNYYTISVSEAAETLGVSEEELKTFLYNCERSKTNAHIVRVPVSKFFSIARHTTKDFKAVEALLQKISPHGLASNDIVEIAIEKNTERLEQVDIPLEVKNDFLKFVSQEPQQKEPKKEFGGRTLRISPLDKKKLLGE